MTLDIEKLKAAAEAATQGADSIERVAAYGTIQQLLNPQAVLELITRLREAEKDVALYKELIYAVERKFPYESRHQTALGYIKRAESGSNSTSAMKESA